MATTSAERMRKLRERKAKAASDSDRHVTASHDVTGDGSDGGTTEGQGHKEHTAGQEPSRSAGVSRDELPPGWRPEWRAPKKPRARAGRRSRGQKGPLPPTPELREEMFRMLREVATDDGASTIARVAAAKAVLEETAPKKLPAPEQPGDVGAELEDIFGGKSSANAA